MSDNGDKSPDNSQSDIIGRKIFFLYPTTSMQNQIVTELIQQEYEVYVAKDHGRLARTLKKYPDSVIFVNIDEGLDRHEWEKWLNTLMSTLKDIRVGIFSSSTDDEVRDKYINILHVTCGFMPVKLDMTKTIAKILEMLKVMNVKGRRKYLRAATEADGSANINMPVNGEFINGTIRDISVVGVSCSFENDPGLSKNALFKDIQLKLQSMLLKVEAVVFGSREEYGEKIYVLIFTQRIDPDVRVKIRKYIQQNLQHKMDYELN